MNHDIGAIPRETSCCEWICIVNTFILSRSCARYPSFVSRPPLYWRHFILAPWLLVEMNASFILEQGAGGHE